MPRVQTESETPTLSGRFALYSAAFFIAVSVGLFARVLFTSPQQLIALPGTDMLNYFLPMHSFGFDELAKGEVAQWNPYSFSGTPFAANFQTALWYPPNWLHLVMNHVAAINWIITLHIALAGWLAALWCRYRGLSAAASLLGGLIFALSGGCFMQTIQGHVTVICAMPWLALLFLSLDGIFRTRRVGWMLVGMVASGMPVLAGHPQTAYYSLLATGLYTAIRLIGAQQRLQVAALSLGAVAGGILLAAVQAIPGWLLASESIRRAGVAYQFSTQDPLPPENLLTLLNGRIFGWFVNPPYFGRSIFSEVNLFVSTAAVLLAIVALAAGGKNLRRHLLPLLVVFLLLAMGPATPLHRWLYFSLPGYNAFRNTSHFSYVIDLIIAFMAASGFDLLLHRPPLALPAAIVALVVSAIGFGLAWWLKIDSAQAPAGTWAALLRAWGPAGSVLPHEAFVHAEFARPWGHFAAVQLAITAAILAACAIALLVALRHPKVLYVLPLIGVCELVTNANLYLFSCPPTVNYPAAWAKATTHSRDERVLYSFLTNTGVEKRLEDVYGYDPVMLWRYARFLAVGQGVNPEDLNWAPQLRRIVAGFGLLRVNNVFYIKGGEALVLSIASPMPRLQLVPNWTLKPADQALKIAATDPEFDPREIVMLESAPDPLPVPSKTPGSVSLIKMTVNSLEIEANVPSPAILLITDAYAPGWQVKSLSPTPAPQANYHVMPADYVVRAIPLAAGKHHLLVYYRAPGLIAGAIITLSVLTLLVGATAVVISQSRRLQSRQVVAAQPFS